jgi:O-6-methylguanine DNA methyltransferase
MANWAVAEGELADRLPMRLYLAEQEGKLWAASLCDDDYPRSEDEFLWRLRIVTGWRRWRGGAGSDVLADAVAQVSEYFAGRRLQFDLPLHLRGTRFQVQVWEELMRIPFGVTCSYGDLAELIGHPTAFRAVGGANGRNNLPVFIPCHRVLAAGGKLGGFTGGTGLKKRLLAHEAAVLGSGTQAFLAASA